MDNSIRDKIEVMPVCKASVEKWKGFQVPDDDDITQNKELMNHLSNRRSGGKRISLSEVKEKLGL
jgi:hypothetical protein